jgi:predicted enzyme related to lactoylglutathione lyase
LPREAEDSLVKETGAIDYVEIPARDIERTKTFFGEVFGWSFVD